MTEDNLIKCPSCGKVLGEWKGDHVEMKKAQLLVYDASAMPKVCPRCGSVFDMMKLVKTTT